MPLELTEIQKIVKDRPYNQKAIQEAIKHEQRISLHCEVTLERYATSPAVNFFLAYAKSRLTREKYIAFLSNFRYPIATVELCEKMFSELEKVFDGQDAVFNYNFTSSELQSDWQRYRSEVLDFESCWREKGVDAMKLHINSVLIVDLERQQETSRPAPYWYWLRIEDVHDFQCDPESGQMEWIVFITHEGKFGVFDDQQYRVFNKTEKGELGSLDFESTHTLNYCPAHFFWSTPLNTTKKHVKRSPVTKQLNDLDYMLYKIINERNLDDYASVPITWLFTDDCDYNSGEGRSRVYCDDGFLRSEYDRSYLMEGSQLKKCPACSDKRLNGAGTIIESDPPSNMNGKADLRDPAGFINPDVDILEYNAKRIKDLESYIYRAVTGYGGEPTNDQAINEKQVVASYDGKTTILRNLAPNFEKAQKWVEETMCLLRYQNAFVSCSISYGSEFYLMSAKDILGEYTEQKQYADDLVLDGLYQKYINTKYRNNPSQIYRSTLLMNLDPFRHRSIDQVTKMYNEGQITYPDFMLKVNLSTLIMRFELDNVPIEEFGLAIPFASRVKAIQDSLRIYAEQMLPQKDGTEVGDIGRMLELIGIGTRAGVITPQTEDEEYIRTLVNIPEMSKEARDAWLADKGIRRPVTLKSQTQIEAETGNIE